MEFLDSRLKIDQNFLQQFVEIVGEGLEDEHKKINIMNIYYNERFLQYIIFRSLLLANCPVDAESNYFDINIYDDVNKNIYGALGEITCWRSSGGDTELPKIKNDINKLIRQSCPGFIIICTVNHKDQTDENIKFLSDNLGLNKNVIKYYRFTLNKEPNNEFIVLAFWAKEPSLSPSD